MSDISILRCAWLVRPNQEPVRDQKLSIEDGILVEITDVPADERSLIEPVAVLPGFVNAHTHLEFSSLAEPLQPALPFTSWIRSVVQFRQSAQSYEDWTTTSVEAGHWETRSTGSQLVGEICTSDIGREALVNCVAARNCSAVCFRELLGFTSDRISELQALATNHVASLRPDANKSQSGIQSPVSSFPAVSPHAPYSVHPEVVSFAAQLASSEGIPIAMHLAETTAELEMLQHRRGPFVQFLQSLDLWQEQVLSDLHSVLDYFHLMKDCSSVLAVHGNYLNSDELQFLAGHPNFTTVYCVRTHRFFQHQPHPWKELLSQGAGVILGTDSRASNPDLSILKELQTLCLMNPGESLVRRLPMITTEAAAALGFDARDVALQTGRPFLANAVKLQCDSISQLERRLLTVEEVFPLV